MTFRKLLALMAVLSMTASAAGASVIGFEDFYFDPSDSQAFAFPPAGYAGFDWGGGQSESSWVVSPDTSEWFGGPQAYAGNNFAWSDGGTSLDLQRDGGGTFNFTSFEGKFFTPSGITGDIEANGYLGGILIYSVIIPITDQYSL